MCLAEIFLGKLLKEKVTSPLWIHSHLNEQKQQRYLKWDLLINSSKNIYIYIDIRQIYSSHFQESSLIVLIETKMKEIWGISGESYPGNSLNLVLFDPNSKLLQSISI